MVRKMRHDRVGTYNLSFSASPVTPCLHNWRNKGENWGVWAEFLLLELKIFDLDLDSISLYKALARRPEM